MNKQGKFYRETEHQMTVEQAADTVLRIANARPHIRVSLGSFDGVSVAQAAREAFAAANSYDETVQILRHQGITLEHTHAHILIEEEK